MKFKLISTIAILVVLASFSESCTKTSSLATTSSSTYGTSTTTDSYGTYTEPASTYSPYQQSTTTSSTSSSSNANYNIVDSIDDNPLINKAKGTTTASSTTSSSTTSSSSAVTLNGDNLQNIETSLPDNYSLAGSFNVDQDTYLPGGLFDSYLPSKNQWRVSGVVAVGTDLLVTASDTSGLFKKGTVILMNSETGQDWKDLGSKWLGVSYPMNSDIKGITFDSDGNVYANSAKGFLYVLSQPSFSVVKNTSDIVSGLDIASIGSGIVVVSTSTGLKKYTSSDSFAVGTDFAKGLVPTGGVCTDSDGNLYVVSSNAIKKVNSSLIVSTVISDVGTAPIDVAVTDSGKIFVLTSSGIKIYSSAGVLAKTFAQGDVASPVSISASGEDIFVGDAGTTYKDSKVLRYSTVSL